MKTLSGKDWAYFLKRLGLPYLETAVVYFVEKSKDDKEVWDHYIASNQLYLAAAQANRIENSDDVARFLRDADYAHMRSTFPSKARGRSVIGPRLVPLRKLQENGIVPKPPRETVAVDKKTKPSTKPKKRNLPPSYFVGKKIYHSGDNGNSFGLGTITKVQGELITVQFESVGTKVLSYPECTEKRYIRIINR